MRVVTIAYFAIVRPDLLSRVKPGGDASRVKWIAIDEALSPKIEDERLAFDHEEIVATALARLIERLETTSIAKNLVPDPFTIPELRATFEIVSGKKLDRGNFRRKFTHLLETGVVEIAPGKRATASKPASVYRFRSAT
jgi:8-oxo-dGTP diphosphatase